MSLGHLALGPCHSNYDSYSRDTYTYAHAHAHVRRRYAVKYSVAPLIVLDVACNFTTHAQQPIPRP